MVAATFGNTEDLVVAPDYPAMFGPKSSLFGPKSSLDTVGRAPP
ncbi:hypothetical protein [[Actinomadura] parvosata]|nr:hypothetical protein [Nonomuraea sp. ATCC 55076]